MLNVTFFTKLNDVCESRNLGWEREFKVSGTSAVQGHVRFLHSFALVTHLKKITQAAKKISINDPQTYKQDLTKYDTCINNH